MILRRHLRHHREGTGCDIEEHIADLIDEGGFLRHQALVHRPTALGSSRSGTSFTRVKDFRLGQIAHARRHGYVKDMFVVYGFRSGDILSGTVRYRRRRAAKPGTCRSKAEARVSLKLGMARLFREAQRAEVVRPGEVPMQIHDSSSLRAMETEFVPEVARGCRTVIDRSS